MATISIPSSRFYSHSQIFLKSSSFVKPPNLLPIVQKPIFPGIHRRVWDCRVLVPVARACGDVARGVRPGGVVKSDKLSSDVRKRTMDAVDACGGRVTIGDVATEAGLKLNEAQKALQALAADTNGFLEVSKDGDILYVFLKHYRSKLVAKSFRIRAELVLEEAKAAGGYLIKLSFGTTLMAPLFLLYATAYNMHISDNDDHGIETFLKPVERFLPKEVLLYIMAPFLFYTMASALLSGIRNKGNHTLGKLYDKVKLSFSKLNLIQVLPTLYLFSPLYLEMVIPIKELKKRDGSW